KVPALGAAGVAFSADGKHLAGVDDRNRVVVCEAATGNVLYRLEGLSHRPEHFAFSPDGKALASGGTAARTVGGQEVVVWDLSSRKVRCQPVNETEGGISS